MVLKKLKWTERSADFKNRTILYTEFLRFFEWAGIFVFAAFAQGNFKYNESGF